MADRATFGAARDEVAWFADRGLWTLAVSRWTSALTHELADAQAEWTRRLWTSGPTLVTDGDPATRRLSAAAAALPVFASLVADKGAETTIRDLMDAWEDAA